jgi:hypothetical protein
LPQLGLQLEPDFIERLVAGDVSHLTGAGGRLPAGLEALVQRGFETGFAHGFLVAGITAAVACAIVYGCMRDPKVTC